MQITRRQEKIIRTLMNADEFLSASQLSKALKVSEKTIRNEIQALKDILGQPIIESVRGKGYILSDVQKGNSLLEQAQSIPAKRQILILKHIISHKQDDYYDVADQFYISESTLEKDIQQINKQIAHRFDGIKIVREKNQLYLAGDESKKREVTTYFLISEIQEYDFNFSNYTSYFKYCNIVDVKQNTMQFFKENQIEISDMALVSLILHLGIMIDRVKSKNYLKSFVKARLHESDAILCEQFICFVQQYIQEDLPESEMNYLRSIFVSKISLQNEHYDEEKQLRQFIDTMLQRVNEFYQVDVQHDTDFKHNLLIHLIALNQRTENNKYLQNPLIDDIRKNFPLIYDMSVFISLEIQNELQCKLSEDEIGYISLHLMCEVEKMSKTKGVILLVNPNGNTSSRYIAQRIHNEISQDIEVRFHSSLAIDALPEEGVDLIVSTIPLNQRKDVPFYMCSSFITEKEIDDIRQLLKMGQQASQENVHAFASLFHENLFFPQLDIDNKDALIQMICDRLVELEYVDENYIHSIMKREQIAPTSFGMNFAIPHPVEKIALKSAMAVASLKKPIIWGEQEVQLVFLFSLANGAANITDMYEVLLTVMEDEQAIQAITEAKTFDEFLSIMK